MADIFQKRAHPAAAPARAAPERAATDRRGSVAATDGAAPARMDRDGPAHAVATENSKTTPPTTSRATVSATAAAPPHVALAELLFFAYRDFTGEPDAELATYNLGRAHHRVLHFVARHPGLRVADLLEVLKITKQSLARVLKQLVDDGWIEQRPGDDDRRERRLKLTPRGHDLANRLMALQSDRLASAMQEAGISDPALVERFLFAMIAAQERTTVTAMLKGDPRKAAAADNAAKPDAVSTAHAPAIPPTDTTEAGS